MTIYYRVNIARPSIYVEDQNKRLCEYIEPLKEGGKVKVSKCYSHNLENHRQGKSCVHGPGYKYFFWFTEREIAQKFIDDWMEELSIPDTVVMRNKKGSIPGKDYYTGEPRNNNSLCIPRERANKFIEYSDEYYIDEEATKGYYKDYWTRIVEEEIDE